MSEDLRIILKGVLLSVNTSTGFFVERHTVITFTGHIEGFSLFTDNLESSTASSSKGRLSGFPQVLNMIILINDLNSKGQGEWTH